MQRSCKILICLLAAMSFLAVTPLFSFSQLKDSTRSQLMSQLCTARTDTGRVHLLLGLGRYYKDREYYLYKTRNSRMQLDSAYFFADQALHLAQALKYENGRIAAIVLKAEIFVRKHYIGPALGLVSNLHDSIRFHILVTLAQHYLFHSTREKTDLDSSLFFLEQANRIPAGNLPARLLGERLHVRAMQAFITKGFRPCEDLYLKLIAKTSLPGNEEAVALLWHELATLIPLREKTGVTRELCYEKMFSLYTQSGNQERQAYVLKMTADVNLVNGNLDMAEKKLLESLERYKAIGFPDLRYLYDLLAASCRYKGDFSKCVFYGLKAVENMEITHESSSATTFYRRLADMYLESGQPDKSIEWNAKAARDRFFTHDNNVNIFRDAGFFARELIKVKREKDALEYIRDINTKTRPSGVDAEACLLGSLAFCYHAVKQEQQAERYYRELIKLSPRLQNDNEITTEVHCEIGQHLLRKLQYGQAAVYLQKALQSTEAAQLISVARDIHLLLYRADSGMGHYPSAMQHLLRHKALSDSIFNETKSWQMQELRVQFETAKKEKDIELLNNQNELQRIGVGQANKARNITLVFVALLLVIVGLLFNRYLLKNRTNNRLKLHQKELDQKNAFLETLNNKQDTLLKEKEWLVKEIHHRVKNNLQMVTSLLNSQSAYLDNHAAVLAIKDSLRRMQAMSLIHQKLYLSGNISTISMPEYISDLMNYLHESFDTGNRIVFGQTVAPLALDVSQAIPLGLIINECVVNAIKYAFPDNRKGIVRIHLQHEEDDSALLHISDNGIGLPVGFDLAGNNSLGLELVRGLAKQLNGNITIVSAKGLCVMIRFALMPKPVSDGPLINS